MIRKTIFAALAAIAIPVAATAQTGAPAPAALVSPEVASVLDKPKITLDPTKGYIMVHAPLPVMVALIRRPNAAEIEEYRKLRAEALAKAHGKWVKAHASWEKSFKFWQTHGKQPPRPVEPVEPTDANLTFLSLDQYNLFQMGPLFRFAKSKERSTWLAMVSPGRYAYYGPLAFAPQPAGTCMCMGTIEFEVKAGEVTDIGTVKLSLADARAAASAAGKPLPTTELDLPEDVNTVGWQPPVAGDPVDPRLAGYKVVPAELHAGPRFPNYYGVAIDRLTPVPGVLAYDRDRIIDVKTGQEIKAGPLR